MINETFIDLSRLQFAGTALYHFLFVPLTLGLIWIVFMMEAVYVMTGKVIYKDMAKFWGKLFGINFAMGILTGLTMEFQFGTNWSYYSHYVGDVFGAPLAIEALSSFFMESTFVGLMFLGWDKLTKRQHLAVTFLTAVGTNLSALWILIANGWMQFPVGAEFSYKTMRMEMVDFAAVLLNPVAQSKFIHTVAAGYVTGAMFVMGISAWYMLKGRDLGFAKRSFSVAVGFGVASILSVLVLGDESGYTIGQSQKTKLAVIEAEYETAPAPAPFTIIGLPDDEKQETAYALRVPYALGLIATRSTTKEVTGIKDIIKENEIRVANGKVAYSYLTKLRNGETSEANIAAFDKVKKDLGYGLLLKRYIEDPSQATTEQVKMAARSAVPPVMPIFLSFRMMVGLGIYMLVVIFTSFYYNAHRTIQDKRWLLKIVLWSIPAPFLAIEFGWFIAEFGRQPWAIGEILPTFLAASDLTVSDMIFSITGFVVLYTIFLIIEMYLMFKFARLGPSTLHTGRYHHESGPQTLTATL
jgi:cytochrome bd ubiquinol oxidase subunit I